jgi:glutathione S-transferase
MSTQEYKLIYFAARGLAEPIRLMLALAGVNYDDHRFNSEDKVIVNGTEKPRELIELKQEEQLPFGQVPVLEVGNGINKIVLAQSPAITRYVAREHGYFGKNNLESALIDSAYECVRDATSKFRAATTDDDKTKFLSEYLPGHFDHLNRFIEQHSTSADKSTCVGSSVSLADVIVYWFCANFDELPAFQKLVESAPYVFAVHKATANHPLIKAWVSTRPVTQW